MPAFATIYPAPPGAGPASVLFDGTDMWSANISSGSITKYQLDGTILGTFPLGLLTPRGLGFDGAHIWISQEGASTDIVLANLDGSHFATYDGAALGIICTRGAFFAFDGTAMWCTSELLGTVVQVSIAGALLSTVPSGTGSPFTTLTEAILYDGTFIWSANAGEASVTQIDPLTAAALGTFSVGNLPDAITFDGTNIWVANSGDNTVTELVAATGALVGTFPVGTLPDALTFDGTSVWCANQTDNTVSQIDPADGSLIALWTVGNKPLGLAFDGTWVWVANQLSDDLRTNQPAGPAPSGVVIGTFTGFGKSGLFFGGTK